MNNSHSSPHSQQVVYRRNVRINRRSSYDLSSDRQHVDEPYDQGIITPLNYQPMGSNGINITNISDRDSVDRLLRPDVADNRRGRSMQNWGNPPYYSLSTHEQNDALEMFRVTFPQTYTELHVINAVKEDEEDVILGYFKTRTYHVVVPKDGVNNPMKTDEEICVICHGKFEHEETIGTLGCGHEYHTGCIKQWLLRKKNCPMCRAPVFPFTSTKTTTENA